MTGRVTFSQDLVRLEIGPKNTREQCKNDNLSPKYRNSSDLTHLISLVQPSTQQLLKRSLQLTGSATANFCKCHGWSFIVEFSRNYAMLAMLTFLYCFNLEN